MSKRQSKIINHLDRQIARVVEVEAALRQSSSQVDLSDLIQKFQGKRVAEAQKIGRAKTK
jgi:hypothetical protein